MPEKLSPRMRTYYILIVAVIVLFSFGAIAGLLYLLEGLGVIPSLGIYTLISLLLVSGITVALMSYFIGRRVLTPLVKLSSASKEVARGNFDVTVSDSSKMEEVQSTFRNFNAMVRELKSISTLSSDFIANVSHEFKTPLSVIEGYAMLLQDDRLTAQEREDYLNKILVNTRRLNTLVGNILMLSKMETKPLPEQYTRFRLDEAGRRAARAAVVGEGDFLPRAARRGRAARLGAGAALCLEQPDLQRDQVQPVRERDRADAAGAEGVRRRDRLRPRLRHGAGRAGAHFREILSGRHLS